MSSATRRRHARFLTLPAYTPVALRTLDTTAFDLHGHAYNVSESGVMFELDRGIDPGTPVALQITMPRSVRGQDQGPGRSIFVMGNVIWLDDSEPGPARMAVAITSFARAGDRERLLNALNSGKLAKAA